MTLSPYCPVPSRVAPIFYCSSAILLFCLLRIAYRKLLATDARDLATQSERAVFMLDELTFTCDRVSHRIWKKVLPDREEGLLT
jgi:hypothetical protein